MHQSTTPSLSQTIWQRWASTQFLTFPIVQTLLAVTFAYSLSCRYERIEEMKEAVTKGFDTLTQEDFHGTFQKLFERYNKCLAAGGDYFEGDEIFMCALSIKVPIRKRSGDLFNDPRMYLPDPSTRTGWDTWSIFKRSLTGLNSDFLLQHGYPSMLSYLPIAGGRIIVFIP